MKYLPSLLSYLIKNKQSQRNIRSLAKFLLFLAFAITGYSVLFHWLMEMEGQTYSWITGFYWTLTVMSTLGFGDITFSSDIGRFFSVIVLLSGVVFLLVMLPFTFIQFFYAPFLEAQSNSRVPRSLPEETKDHLIIIGFDDIVLSLVPRLAGFNYSYVILVNDVQQALELLDQGYNVVLGRADDPDTYLKLRASAAAMIVALSDDIKNTNASFIIREVVSGVPIVANAEMDESVTILQLAGATHVFQFMKMLGEILARRTLGKSTRFNQIGQFDELFIVEAPAMRTVLVGQTIQSCGLREATGMNIVGIWNRGTIEEPRLDTVIDANTVLVLAGSEEQLAAYDQFIGESKKSDAPALILGGGRVGHAAAIALKRRGVSCRIVEKNPRFINDDFDYVLGNASDLSTLVKAGINEAPAVLVTTHTDELNVYLTIFCRRLNPDIQIISRATLDRNISVMHKAGADLVMSYATLAANTIVNLLQPGKLAMLTEGLNIFKVDVPPRLIGMTLAKSNLRLETGCNVIAVSSESQMDISPSPQKALQKGDTLILIGSAEAEKRYIEKYVE